MQNINLPTTFLENNAYYTTCFKDIRFKKNQITYRDLLDPFIDEEVASPLDSTIFNFLYPQKEIQRMFLTLCHTWIRTYNTQI